MRGAGERWWHDPWWRWGLLATGATTLAALLVGFLWLPSAQGDVGAEGLWAGICRAAGVPQTRGGEPKSVTQSEARTTEVVFGTALDGLASADAAGHGATLAVQRCTMCHGARGVSSANVPNLAGQYPEVIVKQLADYRHGDRSSSVMQAIASDLSEADVVRLAAYYTALAPHARADGAEGAGVPALVLAGDAMRNIAPCASCHGGLGRKVGAPWLAGMPRDYLVAQLSAFAAGTRHNDGHAQMRNMARRLSAAEVDALAAYYAGR